MARATVRGWPTWLGYARLLAHPARMLVPLAVLLVAAIYLLGDVTFDASSETLVVEGDEEFLEYVALAERFPSDDFVLVTLTPDAGLFTPQGLAAVDALQRALAVLPGVTTMSLLDAPFIDDVGMGPIRERLAAGTLTREAARRYLRASHLFNEQLVSADAQSASVRVTLPRALDRPGRGDLLEALQNVCAKFRDQGAVHVAGVPLISHEMMRYVRSDVVVFGLACLAFMCVVLWWFFRSVRWVLLPLANAALTVTLMLGLIGLLHTPISVVSANFISLLAIVSVSLNVHLIVKYRELLRQDPQIPLAKLVLRTMQVKFLPCLYTTLTTLVAFASLQVSGIPPVEDFGWMMSVGVLCAFAVAYTAFPGALMLIGKGAGDLRTYRPVWLSVALGDQARRRPGAAAAVLLIAVVASAAGISNLNLDSRFSGYFKPDSSVRSGLEFVDSQFGGVLPLDVVVRLPAYEPAELDMDDDFFSDVENEYPQSAWFTAEKVQVAARLGAALRSHPDVGSVTSLADLEALARARNGGQRLDDFELSMLVMLLGDGRQKLLEPYANPESGELRVAVRMKESIAAASYPVVVNEIERFAQAELGLEPGDVSTSGMFILFGKSIRQLLTSQLQTLLVVVGGTLLMFVALLKSWRVGLIGLSVNVAAAAMVLGTMGFVGISLDMMTITIASIAIGIGVDNAFHYLDRYQRELGRGRSPIEAIRACHLSIGRAIFLTGLTVAVGFSILALSSFLPTIYFGLLTALAMCVALVANLLFLPALLLVTAGWRSAPDATSAA